MSNAKQRALAWLEENNVPYTLVEHAPAFTMEDVASYGVGRRGTVCKNLFLRDSKRGRRHLLLTVRGNARIDLKQLAGPLGENFSFASAARLEQYLGLRQGEVSPLGLMHDEARAVEVFFDDSLAGDEVVGVHPCVNTATVFMRFGDLKALVEKHGNPVGRLHIPHLDEAEEPL